MPADPVPAAGLKVGLLCNPQSGRALHRLPALRDAAAAIPGAIYREASSRLDMVSALDQFSQNGVQVLAVIGGDGTVHAVLSHLFGTGTDPELPMLTIIPAGTTNMTAADLGIRGGPLAVLARLRRVLERPDTVPARIRPVLRVEHAGLLLHGMFFGTGMIAEGVRFFLERVRGSGITGEKASALVMARALVKLLLSGRNKSRAEFAAGVSLDGGAPEEGRYLLVLASTLERLLLGMRAFWGRDPAPVHFTAISASPARLWRQLPRIVTGRGEHLQADEGYMSRNVNALELQMDGDFVVDGQLYRADRGQGPVRVSAVGPVRFLSP